MAAIKEGSIMEGIFAMYCAAYLVDPNNGKTQSQVESFIDELRLSTTIGKLKGNTKSVDYNNTFPAQHRPSKKHFKDVSIIMGDKAKKKIEGIQRYDKLAPLLKNNQEFFETFAVDNYNDFTQVELKIRVKEAETGTLYGTNLKKIVEKIQKQEPVNEKEKKTIRTFNNIRLRMKTLIKEKETTFFKSLRDAKMRYIKNSKRDVIKYTVDADGIAGEGTGGDVKTDVTIKIMADGKKILEEDLNFSLKASSVTVEGGGLGDNFPVVFEMFEDVIPQNKITEARKFYKVFEAAREKGRFPITTKEALDSLWTLIGESIPTNPDTQWSSKLWSILERKMYGRKGSYTGKIQVLEMNPNEIREVALKNFLRLSRDSGCLLFPKFDPKYPLQYYIMPQYMGEKGKSETNTDKAVYKIRLQRATHKEKGIRGNVPYPHKVNIELGGVKSIIHDENYGDFVKNNQAKDVAFREIKSYKPL